MTTKNSSIDTESGEVSYIDECTIGNDMDELTDNINRLMFLCHGVAVESGWWDDIRTDSPIIRNDGEMLCLMHSELSEAMEGLRKDLMDTHLPERKMAEVELADCVIRIMDFAGAKNYDLGGAVIEKIRYNTKRADHKPENRAKEGGKKF